jgi:tetratricopeptide (TPR) repeat protein
MKIPPARLFASLLLSFSLLPSLPANSATPAPKTAGVSKERNDYADTRFTTPLAAGLKHFYACDFKSAESDFDRALAVIPDNTFAISFLNAAAAHLGDDLTVLTNREEDAVSTAPKNYVDHVRLGFSYMFSPRDRGLDAREEMQAAIALNGDAAAAHVGMGIIRVNERSANRAKTEMLAALRSDANNVLAREYLAQIYQVDLRDPQRGMAYAIDVPNLVPGYADIQFHIGSLLYDLRQLDPAIASLRRGIDMDACHAGEAGQHGYTLIARIQIEQKKCADAEKTLTAAIKADADAIFARTLLDRVKNGGCAAPSPNPSGRRN